MKAFIHDGIMQVFCLVIRKGNIITGALNWEVLYDPLFLPIRKEILEFLRHRRHFARCQITGKNQPELTQGFKISLGRCIMACTHLDIAISKIPDQCTHIVRVLLYIESRLLWRHIRLQ